MAGRFKDSTFNLADSHGNIETWERVSIAALYDIRDELKILNGILRCPNFLAIPRKLDRISKNTAKPRKRKSQANRGTVTK
jgi:hypothetical protein